MIAFSFGSHTPHSALQMTFISNALGNKSPYRHNISSKDEHKQKIKAAH